MIGYKKKSSSRGRQSAARLSGGAVMQSRAALPHTSVLNFNIRREKGSETIQVRNFHLVGVPFRICGFVYEEM